MRTGLFIMATMYMKLEYGKMVFADNLGFFFSVLLIAAFMAAAYQDIDQIFKDRKNK